MKADGGVFTPRRKAGPAAEGTAHPPQGPEPGRRTVFKEQSSWRLWEKISLGRERNLLRARRTFKVRGPSLVQKVSLEKIPNLVKADGANVKMNSTATPAVPSCSTSSSAVSTPPVIKPVLMSKSVPPSPEKILNGKGILSTTIDKKHQNGTKNNNKPYRRLSGEENIFVAQKEEGSKMSIKRTHSLSHRRAVPGRKKQFDLLLAEHKAKSREKEVKDKEHLLTSAREVLPNPPGPAQDSLPGPSGSSGPEPKVASPAKSRPPNSVLPRYLTPRKISKQPSVQGENEGEKRGMKIPPAADSPMPSPAAHLTTPVPASVLQPFSNPSAVYLPSAPISSRLTSSYIMTSAMLSNAAFVTSPDPSALMSHTTAFPHVAATLSIMDSTFKAPPAVSPIPAVIASPSHKPSKTKTSKSSKVKDLSARSDESPSNKKRKPQSSTSSSSSSLPLQTSLASPLSGPHKKNCVLNASSALNSYQAAPPYNSLSVHNSNNGVSPLSAKLEPSGRTSLPGGPTDLVRHVGSGGGSSDSCPLSVPTLAGDLSLASHNAVSSLPLSFDKSEGKKRGNTSSTPQEESLRGLITNPFLYTPPPQISPVFLNNPDTV
ncbi:hypothetical protein MJG53_006371 [Ovis ammon polii x Ovis aries]|uniref:SCA7 domain-containing protein n=2 Tax=Ovis TaxID=9935 RepID=A0A836D696_SHEEP|nr:hypothetical protein JEQ12_015472 [Ovis aries]KAI4584837.1 hypothetical protein MJG53_006371 [Ovis ammon polii x Ovis aries]